MSLEIECVLKHFKCKKIKLDDKLNKEYYR